MNEFLSGARERLSSLVELQSSTTRNYQTLIKYMGEKPDQPDNVPIFSIIHQFLVKFDAACRQYREKVEKNCLSPRSPSTDKLFGNI